jgi:hypothetical protein
MHGVLGAEGTRSINFLVSRYMGARRLGGLLHAGNALARFVCLYLLRMVGVSRANYYPGMRNVYVDTRGRNRALARLNGWLHPRRRHAGPPVLARHGDCDSRAAELRREGLAIYEAVVPADMIEAIRGHVDSAQLTPVWASGRSGPERLRFDPNEPVPGLVTAWLDTQKLVEIPEVIRLAIDPSILDTARAYLGCEPILDISALWWTQPSPEASSESAQLWHFDCDRVKFLKFFFYLTDVDQESGPHCFIKRTHLVKPPALWRDGRLSDGEIEDAGLAAQVTEIHGAAGTVFAEDTIGFHKGMPASRGCRLVLELQYSTDLFGCPYDKWTASPEIQRLLRDHGFAGSRVFANFHNLG